MGERTNGLSEAGFRPPIGAAFPEEIERPTEVERATEEEEPPAPVEIEQEIEELRGDLTTLVQELDRRRHVAFDLRLQVRRHAGTIVLFLGATSLLLVSTSMVRSRRRRRREALLVQNATLRRFLASMVPQSLIDSARSA
jgi:hypothetical protein